MMEYRVIAVTNGHRLLDLRHTFHDLKMAQKEARALLRECGDCLINVQIKANDEHHIETIGDAAIFF